MSNSEMDQITNLMTTYMVVSIVASLVLSLAALSLAIWALIDVARRPMRDASGKALWILAIVFIPIIGPIVYLSVRRSIAAPHSSPPAPGSP